MNITFVLNCENCHFSRFTHFTGMEIERIEAADRFGEGCEVGGDYGDEGYD